MLAKAGTAESPARLVATSDGKSEPGCQTSGRVPVAAMAVAATVTGAIPAPIAATYADESWRRERYGGDLINRADKIRRHV